MADEKRITLEIFRYNPEDGGEPFFQSYEVEYLNHWVVLDAINWIKDEIDGTIAHRWTCRMGVCGSCGMMVNGEPKLSCHSLLRDYAPGPVRVEPLQHFPVEKDLVVDMNQAMESLAEVKPYIIRDDVNDTGNGEYLQTPAQIAAYHEHSMCINCLLCYAGCPVMSLEPAFLGPAALALGQRYNLDSRDKGQAERVDAMSGDEGLWGCTFVGECSVVCPKHVDPAGAIQKGKIAAAKQWYANFVKPKGAKK